MPASVVVQVVLWPQTIADWARDARVATAVVYNLLARVKPYRRVREMLALRLESPAEVLDHLIDAPRPLPSAMRAPQTADTRGHATESTPPPPPPPPSAGDWSRAGGPLSTVRDGRNPLELRAVHHAWRSSAALPASLLIQFALFPETLAEWARRRNVPASALYATLAGSHRSTRIRSALARQLDVSTVALDHVIDASRREPPPPATAPLADLPSVTLPVPAVDHPSADRPVVDAEGARPPDRSQLSLAL